MNTYIFELVSTFGDRWREVDVLLGLAKSEEEKQPSMSYDAVCRASVLLIVAQLEAFLKDTARGLVNDFNHYSKFHLAPTALKRTFCRDYVEISDNGKENETRTKKLIGLLDQLDPKFSFESFLVKSDYEYRKNPSPGVIIKICSNFGIKNIFSWLNSEKLGIVFSGTTRETVDLIDVLRNYLLKGVASFPYNIDLNAFDICDPGKNNDSTNQTLWKIFIDQLLKDRNDIAHGSVSINSLSVSELVDYKNKIIIFEYALLSILCNKVISA